MIIILFSQSIPILDSSAASAEEMFSGNSSTIQLIDFGRSIDLSLLPPNVSFSQVVKCDGITCTEMKEAKPWREHIDYHGLAAISYCLLFQSYMETVKVSQIERFRGNMLVWGIFCPFGHLHHELAKGLSVNVITY